MAPMKWPMMQRPNALNLFIDDVYHHQRCVTSGVVPSELVSGSPNFRRECVGIDPPGGVWAHICGSDLIRDAEGTVYVLEDNIWVPSGVSYLLENRIVAKHVFPSCSATTASNRWSPTSGAWPACWLRLQDHAIDRRFRRRRDASGNQGVWLFRMP